MDVIDGARVDASSHKLSVSISDRIQAAQRVFFLLIPTRWGQLTAFHGRFQQPAAPNLHPLSFDSNRPL
jgi:hypothetical protein